MDPVLREKEIYRGDYLINEHQNTYGKSDTELKQIQEVMILLLIRVLILECSCFYNVVLLSAVQQSESAISIDVSPLSWISFLFTFSEALEGNLHTLWFFTSEHFSVDFLGIGR